MLRKKIKTELLNSTSDAGNGNPPTETPLSQEQFRLLCQQYNGIAIDRRIDAKVDLLTTIDGRLQEVDDFENDATTFPHDPEDHAAVRTMLIADRIALTALRDKINVLDAVECADLREKIAEVYARAAQSAEADLYEISQAV